MQTALVFGDDDTYDIARFLGLALFFPFFDVALYLHTIKVEPHKTNFKWNDIMFLQFA